MYKVFIQRDHYKVIQKDHCTKLFRKITVQSYHSERSLYKVIIHRDHHISYSEKLLCKVIIQRDHYKVII